MKIPPHVKCQGTFSQAGLSVDGCEPLLRSFVSRARAQDVWEPASAFLPGPGTSTSVSSPRSPLTSGSNHSQPSSCRPCPPHLPHVSADTETSEARLLRDSTQLSHSLEIQAHRAGLKTGPSGPAPPTHCGRPTLVWFCETVRASASSLVMKVLSVSRKLMP